MLKEVKRQHGEHTKGNYIVDPRVHGVAHTDDGVHWQAIQVGIKRQHHIGVEHHIHQAYKEGGNGEGPNGALLGMSVAVNNGRWKHKAHTPYKITKIAYKGCRGTLENELQNNFYYYNTAAAHWP